MNDEAPDCAGPAPRPVAAFDFDGTLTVEDSFLAFLRWRTSPWRWVFGLAQLAPALTVYLFARDRDRLKGAAIRVFLGGLTHDALTREADGFAATTRDRLFRPDALEAWSRHGAAGDLRVIVTASPEEIVRPFALHLHADALIGSRIAWMADGRVGRGLDGRNCRGAEKVRRLRERFGPGLVLTDAYGDTAGDREMLAIATRPHMRCFAARPSPKLSRA